MRIGVLAEDMTDCRTAEVLIARIAEAHERKGVGVDKRGDAGCGNLKRKMLPWLNDLARKGCTAAIILHDLDLDPNNSQLNDEAKLRANLERRVKPSTLARLICIPVEELEAWFWADVAVVQHVGRGKGKARQNPHLIKKPKEQLIMLSRGVNHRLKPVAWKATESRVPAEAG